jgi:UDP-N-acetylmuramoyl-tripeptide--D-alanyl-D-alanine ligase
MMAWRLSELVRCTPGQIVGNDCAFSTVSTDSRTLKPGALFVALSGPSFDGHDFVAAAAERGAAAALVERPLAAEIPHIVTSDPLGALSACAREWRRQFHSPLIGGTGSTSPASTRSTSQLCAPTCTPSFDALRALSACRSRSASSRW